MDSSQRSKSFKALSMAQPIKKDIEQTLNKLQQQKRRYLAADRQEALLKEQVQRQRAELNKLKEKVPETQVNSKKTIQTGQKLKNTDRTYENTLGSIAKCRQQIDLLRKRIQKYKSYNNTLQQEQRQLIKDVDNLVQKIVEKETYNQNIKNQIINYREVNLKNLHQFTKSHKNLNKSNVKEQNQRRKYQVSTKTFLGQQFRVSRLVHFDKVSDMLKGSGIATNEGKADILAETVPIAKQRVIKIIHKNKEKIKIAENYMKFGEGLENMFNIIKQFKGRDDINYLAEQFVKKEVQIQKLGEYIGKLEHQIVSSKQKLQRKEKLQDMLEKQLTKDRHDQSEKHYKQMSEYVKKEIEQLKKDHLKMNEWIKKVGQILCPLVADDDFSRGNATNVIGKIQQKLGINRSHLQRKQQSPTKSYQPPPVEPEEHHQKYAELLSYEKMREYANQYIKNKK